MKQYYEAEVLFQLMEREGFNIPSSVPPYEAEIKAYLINQVKQAYPKLTDYEAEWLLYNYTKHLPAEFPIQTVANATSATFENVVPFAYHTAILKGQTLVNIKGEETNEFIVDGRCHNDYLLNDAKDNTKYLILYDLTPTDTIKIGIIKRASAIVEWVSSTSDYISEKKGKLILNTTTDTVALRIISSENNSHVVNNLTIVEYKEGMENWNIPHFEGMQSVKMPVLTTTGKNLFDEEFKVSTYLAGNPCFPNNSMTNVSFPYTTSSNSRGIASLVKVKPSTRYMVSISNRPENSVLLCAGYENVDSISNYSNAVMSVGTVNETNSSISFTTTSNCNYMVIGCFIKYVYEQDGGVLTFNKAPNIQLEENTSATPYEPYQSNILTVNDDVELRGIGGVRDELDCLTGEMTQRISEIVLDGSEGWASHTDKTNTKVFSLTIKNLKNIDQHIISNRFPTNASGDVEKINNMGNVVYVAILKSKADNLEKFKSYLTQNPITVQYLLATESVKTVELTTVNEKGVATPFMPLEGTMSVQSSGESIQPTFDMSVPVEATTQNLASFINMEMED